MHIVIKKLALELAIKFVEMYFLLGTNNNFQTFTIHFNDTYMKKILFIFVTLKIITFFNFYW